MSHRKTIKPPPAKPLREFYERQQAERQRLLPRAQAELLPSPKSEAAWPFHSSEAKVAHHPWPYSSLRDPLGDYTESEELAQSGGTDHAYALTDPDYRCECENCAARRGAHATLCACRMCLALFGDDN